MLSHDPALCPLCAKECTIPAHSMHPAPPSTGSQYSAQYNPINSRLDGRGNPLLKPGVHKGGFSDNPHVLWTETTQTYPVEEESLPSSRFANHELHIEELKREAADLMQAIVRIQSRLNKL